VRQIAPVEDSPPLPLRVVVTADVALYRETLTRWLSRSPQVTVVGSASSLEETLELARTLQPTVIVVDMATRDAVGLVSGLRAGAPDAKLVAFAVTELEEEIVHCARAGLTGFVPRDASPDRLVSAVQSAARGELICSPRTAAALFERVGALSRREPGGLTPVPFSEREQQIGKLLAEGLANKEIAVRLRIEVATVKNHVRRILAKLRVANRSLAGEYFRASLR
jgi:DNA-binding NarL/FixJ family response regulator